MKLKKLFCPTSDRLAAVTLCNIGKSTDKHTNQWNGITTQ